MANLLKPATSSFRTHSPETDSAELTLTLLGPSSSMAQLWSQVRRLAPHVRTLLLTGEADCGQGAVARLLLDLSSQRDRLFVSLSAAEAEARLLRTAGLAALPTDVLLFLPEVHKFSLAAQEAILRLLRQRRSRGFTLVACTPEDLLSLASLGRFNAELAECLTALTIAIPALRERSEDLPILINHTLSALSAAGHRTPPLTSESFLFAAMKHRWSGNLRELNRTLATLCSEGKAAPLEAEDFFRALAANNPVVPANASSVRLVSLETVVQEHIGSVLRACRGNKLRAAEVLGISRSTLYRMLDSAPTATALAAAS